MAGELVVGATLLEGPVLAPVGCDMFWGSHGCDLPADGHTVHRCTVGDEVEEPCSEFDEEAGRVRYWEFFVLEDGSHHGGQWSEWHGNWEGFRL